MSRRILLSGAERIALASLSRWPHDSLTVDVAQDAISAVYGPLSLLPLGLWYESRFR